MPNNEYDWMNSTAFKEAIRFEVARVASANGIERYQVDIVDKLFDYTQTYRAINESTELVKAAAMRRGQMEAIASIATLIKRASNIATADRRIILESRDFDQAYQEAFCMVWPFCGKRN